MADPKSSGIYAIVNRVNGKQYIGSAVSLPNRRSHHWAKLAADRHHNRHLQAAWKKHPPGTFEFRTLLICDRQDLLLFEQRAINILKPAYNLSPTAGSTLGVKFSPVTKAKIAAKAIGRKYSAETVEKRAAKRRGVKLTPEHVKHLIGNRHAVGLKHTEEWKRLNSLRHTGRSHPKSPECRAKISAALKGIPHSAERRANQAAAQIGLKRKPYAPRAPQSPERLAAIGAAISARQLGKKRSPETVEKLRKIFTGRKYSAESSKKKSEAAKAMWAVKRQEIMAAQERSRNDPNRRKPDYAAGSAKRAIILTGRKASPEARANMAAAARNRKRRGTHEEPPPTGQLRLL